MDNERLETSANPGTDRQEGLLLGRLELLARGRDKLGLKAMQVLLPRPLKLEMSSLNRLGHAAMIVAQAEGYRPATIWEVIAAEGQPLPGHMGLKPG